MEQTLSGWTLAQGVEDSLFEIMWQSAPYISGMVIVAVFVAWISVKIARVYAKFEQNDRTLSETVARLDRVESRLDRIETKLDMVINFLFKGQNSDPTQP